MRPTYRYPPPRPPDIDIEMLRACPFCGGRPVIEQRVVRCPLHTLWMEPADWNRRTTAIAPMMPGRPLLTAPEDRSTKDDR